MKSRFYLVLLFFLIYISGCINPARHIGKDEYLLYKKKIKGNKNIPTEELEALQRQKPNRRVLGYPVYVWFYYWGQNTYDKTRIENKLKKVKQKYDSRIEETKQDNEKLKLRKKKEKRVAQLNRKLEKGSLFMRIIRPAAEAPEIYKEKLTEQTIDQMRLYMQSRGYFNSSASFETKRKGKRVKVNYFIEENEPHKLSSINYIVEDSAIDQLIEKNLGDSHLNVGDNYNVDRMNAERERLERLLKDNGYYSFSRQYIEFVLDTAAGNNIKDTLTTGSRRKVSVDVLVHNPDEGVHKVYKLDSVKFIIDGVEKLSGFQQQNKLYKGVRYYYYKDKYSRKILNYKIFIKPGERYSLRNSIETQRQLLNLDNFKFVNLSYDTTGGKFVGIINASPASKYTTSEELGFSVSQKLPGPTANVTFKARNIFKGMENFESGIRYTFEGVATQGDERTIYRSQELTASSSLIFPHTLFPFNPSFKRSLNRLNPKTRLLVSYTYINRPEYTRSNLKGSLIYTWQKGLYSYFNLAPIDLNLLNTIKVSDALQDSIDNKWRPRKHPLYYAFQKAFVSSINGSYTYNDFFPGINRNAKAMTIYVESGGTVFNLLNKRVFNDSIFGYPYFSFLRLNTDFRYYRPLTQRSILAARFNFGIARPYLTEKKALPYEKYFFAGGSNSIRAWKPRQLGPGSYSDTTNNFYYHYGEILLEMSLEYRFNIFWKLDGAWFVDAGNVWAYYSDDKVNANQTEEEKLLNKDKGRENAEFEWDRFYKEIAVGAGFGLRLNFSFLIIRVDGGYKIYDPSKPLDERVVIKEAVKEPYKACTFHIGINYPF